MNSLFGRLRSGAANIARRFGTAVGSAARGVAGGARRVVSRIAQTVRGGTTNSTSRNA